MHNINIYYLRLSGERSLPFGLLVLFNLLTAYYMIISQAMGKPDLLSLHHPLETTFLQITMFLDIYMYLQI